MILLTVLSVLTCIILIMSLVETVWGLHSLTKLDSVVPLFNSLDRVSVIITACNEESHIAQTLTHLKRQSYPHLEFICINDRSVDETGNILNELTKQDDRIKVKHIDNLPAGWLGKNYAAHQGAAIASGEWLLFIDADVLLEPHAISRALQHTLNRQLDHLSAIAQYKCKGFIYNIVHLIWQGHGLVIPLKPWRARFKCSKKSMNLGVFCLLKKSVYYACGGHAIAPLECVEDYRLGERIKKNGYSTEVVDAQTDITINWYSTLRQHINGYKKNVFAFFRYRLMLVILGIIGWYGFFVWPIFACFVTGGICQTINLINTLLLLLLYLTVSRFFRVPTGYALFFPIGLLFYPYLIISSVFCFYKNKGIYWRGTFYPALVLRNSYK